MEGKTRYLWKWHLENRLKSNTEKRAVLHFGKASEPQTLQLNNSALQVKGSEKDLGVWVDTNLKFKKECRHSCREGIV